MSRVLVSHHVIGVIATALHLLSATATAAAAAAATTSSVSTTTTTTCLQYYQPPNIRYPPAPLSNFTTDTNTSSSSSSSSLPWPAPPATILYSPWHITYSTRPYYLSLTNMASEHCPVFPTSPTFPPGSVTDLITWSVNPANVSDDSVVTVFGYFKPLINVAVAAWNYSSTGPLSQTTNLWAILGWGVDEDGVQYRVDYETGYEGSQDSDEEPCINVASRVPGAPSPGTYGAIVAALTNVGYQVGDMDFVRLVDGLEAMKSDARADSTMFVDCDQACVDNVGLVPGKR